MHTCKKYTNKVRKFETKFFGKKYTTAGGAVVD
jgi:hypothetical protein